MAKKLQIKDAVNLAAPHTWAASVMPCVLASALSYRQQGFLRADLTVCLFLIAILMQSLYPAQKPRAYRHARQRLLHP